MKYDVVSTLKFDVVSTFKSEIVSTLISDGVSTLNYGVETTLKIGRLQFDIVSDNFSKRIMEKNKFDKLSLTI